MLLYRSHAGNHFYGREYKIGADFGSVGNTEKKFWADYEHFSEQFFPVFWAKFFFYFLKNYCSVCTKKLHNISLIIFFEFFFWLKIG